MGLQVGNMSDLFTESVQIMISLGTSDTRTVVERTIGTAIIPGVNWVGFMTWDLRQVFKRPRLSAIASLFDVSIMLAFNLCLLLTTALFFPSLMKILQYHGCSMYMMIHQLKVLSFRRVVMSPPSVWLCNPISLNWGWYRIIEAGPFYKDFPKLEVYGPSSRVFLRQFLEVPSYKFYLV